MTQEQFNLLLAASKKIQGDVQSSALPPSEVMPSTDQSVIPFVVFKNCRRGYIEKLVHQINRCYANTCYDACAVMIRRLVETLIIEVFINRKDEQKLKDNQGDFKYLKDLISITLAETPLHLSRNAKRGLDNLKVIGDLSAHNRRYIAFREDIDKVIPDLRVVSQELLTLAGMT